MAWTEDQWAMFSTVLQRGFAAKEPFTDDDADVYRLFLDGVEPEAALAAIRELMLEGTAYRPKPGEIAARVRRDPSVPTFDEAYQLIFGPRGLLRRLSALERSDTERRGRVRDQFHPLVVSFLDRQGEDRLRTLPIEDPDYGELRRAELERAWANHLEACEGRDVAALAAPRRGELVEFDPLKALDPPAPELTGGAAA